MNPTNTDNGQCPGCPLARGSSCAGIDVPRLCQLIDPDHASYDPSYLAALTFEAVPAPPAPRRPLSESLGLLRAVRACPHRTDQPACGCNGGAACELRGSSAPMVSLYDCFDCLSEAVGQPSSRQDIGSLHDG